MKKIISTILILAILSCSIVAMAADVKLSDIDASHWAYNAIYELVSKGTVNGYPDGTFRPNGTVTYAEFRKMITGVWEADSTPIDREAALDMLWQHSGTPSNYTAPGIITDQMENRAAVAWGYSTGLMQGNDGLNLRPHDTLTRAEAATLIIRSTKPVSGDYSFANSVSEDLLKLIWDNYNIFGSEYVADDIITAEQLQSAAKELGNFKSMTTIFDGNTVEDAAVALIYSGIKQSGIEAITAKNSSAVTDKYGFIPQFYTAYGLENGIVLPKEKAAKATKRDVALLLIQIDALVGRDGIKINKDLSSYPANYTDYPYLAEGIPTAVYGAKFDNGALPKDFYNFVFYYTSIFETFVSEMQSKYCGKNATFTLIPSLIAQGKDEAVMRVKCTITGETTAYALFGAGYENAGNEFYMELHAGDVVKNIYIPTTDAKIGKFICNQ